MPKITLARWIIEDVKSIFLAEETAAIDKQASTEIENRLVRSKYTVVMIIHRLDEEGLKNLIIYIFNNTI